METFQKIYRPEIYNANSPATEQYQPSLKAQDYSLTRIVYDRDERSRLAVEQGRFVEERFIKPHRTRLDQWSAGFAAAFNLVYSIGLIWMYPAAQGGYQYVMDYRWVTMPGLPKVPSAEVIDINDQGEIVGLF